MVISKYNITADEGVRRGGKTQITTTNYKRLRVFLVPHRIKIIPNSNIQVNHLFTEVEPEVKIYSVKFDAQDKYLAAGKFLAI